MSRQRLLYVPIAAGRESEAFAAQVEWAETATFDAPGAGANRAAEPRGVEGVVAAALARLDQLGWERYAIVCDSHGQAAGIELALRDTDRVQGICVGHAAARYGIEGNRPAMVPAMHQAAQQLLETDYRTFARAVTQMTQGLWSDAQADEWIADVPQPVAYDILNDMAERQPELVVRLGDAAFPVVLGKHVGCVMWTSESFDDARAAVPHAIAVECEGIPTQHPAFLDAAREMLSGPSAG